HRPRSRLFPYTTLFRSRFVAERQSRCGAIVVRRLKLPDVSADLRKRALLGMLRQRGLGKLLWDDESLQWRARVMCLRQYHITEKDRKSTRLNSSHVKSS